MHGMTRPAAGPTDDQIVGAVGSALFDMALGDIHRVWAAIFLSNESLT